MGGTVTYIQYPLKVSLQHARHSEYEPQKKPLR